MSKSIADQPTDSQHAIPPAAGKLTQGSVLRHLFAMSWPMVFGILSVIGFNLADTYFVARLGATQLSAISFTFPISMFVFSMTIGLGIGLTAAVSRAIGSGNQRRSRRLTSNGLLLGLGLVISVSCLGIATIDPLFRLLGATDAELPYIHDYMTIWYASIVFMVIPMMGNSAIRATGDAKVPGMVMVGSALLNIILDPIFIFGLYGAPRLEMEGAAVATLLARAITMVICLGILHYRDRLISFAAVPLAERVRDWREILKIGLPATASQLIGPVSFGIITALVAQYGSEAVGGFGIAGRIEAFAIIPIFAMQAGGSPLIGQNIGAGRIDRARDTVMIGFAASAIWGVLMTALLFLAAERLPRLFSTNAEVLSSAASYLTIVPMSFAFTGFLLIATAGFNAIGRPVPGLMLTVVRMIVITVPLAWILSHFMGLEGIYVAAVIANIVTGILGTVLILRFLKERMAQTRG